MTAVADTAAAMATAPACRALGLPRASWYRGRRPVTVARPRPTPPRALELVERQRVRETLELNLFGPWLVTQAFLPLLRKSAHAEIGARP
jgi:NAD(P)-dependent dehydrogenase (short-subunit alcohol dehydrogenase family)